MAYLLVGDEAYEARCIGRVGELGAFVWHRSMLYAARNLTDGHLPTTKIHTLVNFRGIYEEAHDGRLLPTPEPVDPAAVARRLVAAGLWLPVDDGYYVRDIRQGKPVEYLTTQRSATKIRRAQRDSSRQRAAAGRASARQRNGNGKANGSATRAQRDAQRDGNETATQTQTQTQTQ